MSELMRTAIQVTDNDFIAIKPCCQLFEIDYKYQVERIRNDIVTSKLVGKSYLTGADGKTYLMISLPKSGFIRWVYTLNANQIAVKHRQNFIDFISSVHDFLFGGFSAPKLKQDKEDSLNRIRFELQTLDDRIDLNRKEGKELKSMRNDKQEEFWTLFSSNPLQTRMVFPDDEVNN